MAREALTGEGAHVATSTIFDGLDWVTAGKRVSGSAHTVFQLLKHMTYWQDWAVRWLAGRSPAVPKHASGSWPRGKAPASRAAWTRAVRHFKQGLARLDRGVGASRRPRRGKTATEMVALLAVHNSYHAGEVVVLRQLADHWPPPSGGLTW